MGGSGNPAQKLYILRVLHTTLAMLPGSDDPGPGGDGRALSAEADGTAGGGEGSS